MSPRKNRPRKPAKKSRIDAPANPVDVDVDDAAAASSSPPQLPPTGLSPDDMLVERVNGQLDQLVSSMKQAFTDSGTKFSKAILIVGLENIHARLAEILDKSDKPVHKLQRDCTEASFDVASFKETLQIAISNLPSLVSITRAEHLSEDFAAELPGWLYQIESEFSKVIIIMTTSDLPKVKAIIRGSSTVLYLPEVRR